MTEKRPSLRARHRAQCAPPSTDVTWLYNTGFEISRLIFKLLRLYLND